MASIALRAALLIGVLALAACNNANRFGDGADGGFGAGGAGGAGAGAGAGGPSDPTSIAYFQSSVGDRVLFAVDQSTLSPEARNTLTGQARWLAANTGYAAVIEGHADEQGTREYNFNLSSRRAAAVQEFLIAQGVAGARLRTIPFGKERPVEVCSDESCYAQNRRAVTVLQAGGGAGL